MVKPVLGIDKSTRHQAIIGHFGEYLICNWLSRSGFEVALVDHTGIDLVAYNPTTTERFGITVKSRTRTHGTEHDPVNLFRGKSRDRQKVLAACEAFGCEPWIAVYIEAVDRADVFLLSLKHYDENYRGPNAKEVQVWSMRSNNVLRYDADTSVKHIRIDFHSENWWNQTPLQQEIADDLQ